MSSRGDGQDQPLLSLTAEGRVGEISLLSTTIPEPTQIQLCLAVTELEAERLENISTFLPLLSQLPQVSLPHQTTGQDNLTVTISPLPRGTESIIPSAPGASFPVTAVGISHLP